MLDGYPEIVLDCRHQLGQPLEEAGVHSLAPVLGAFGNANRSRGIESSASRWWTESA